MSCYGINAPAILTVSNGNYAGVGGMEDVTARVSSDKERIHEYIHLKYQRMRLVFKIL